MTDHIRTALEHLPHRARVAFAAACAHRVHVIYEITCQTDHVPSGPRKAINTVTMPTCCPRAPEVEALGFAAHWFSDDSQCCLERDDGSFFYIERTKERTSLYGCLADARTRDQVKPVLIAALGLRDSTPHKGGK